MSTYRQIVYMILDQLKLISDDATYTEEHTLFLAKEYRGLLLKQRYSDIKKQIPESNYQTICLDLIEVPAITGEPCEGGSYLRSKEKIPTLMQIGNPLLYPLDYYQGDIAYVSRERMRYVGHNRFLQNIIYASLGPDQYLYMKSNNPQYLYMEQAKMTGIFEDPEEAEELACDKDNEESCDILDKDFPIEEALVPVLIELCVKELSGSVYRPQDTQNNSSDDLSNTPIK